VRSRATALCTWVSLAVSLVTLSSGCTSDSHESPVPPVPATNRYVARECPAEVTAALVGTVECGTLTVPENRTQNTGTVRLLVTSLTPAEVLADDPIVVLGTDIATRPNYAGIAPLTQRTGRRVLILDQRGTGHSEPSLACPPPQDPSQLITWSDRTGSPRWEGKSERLASRCLHSLEDKGVDVSSYNVTEMAADVADLITVLDLAPVDLVSSGSASRIAFELMRTHANALRAVVMDTPDVPGFDPRAVAAGRTDRAVAQVLLWCDQDPDCQETYPEPVRLLRRASATVTERPMSLNVSTQGSRQRVVLDAALLARVARQTLTDGGSAGSWGLPEALPALLTAVADRDRPQVDAALSELLGVQGPLCPGYHGKCMSAHVVDEGVYNTVLCQDIVPFAPSARPARRADQALHQAYDRNWWWNICEHWPTLSAHTGAADPVSTDVPVLILAGGLAASTPERAIRSATRGLRNVSVILAPTGSHNVIGQPCLNRIRVAWLNDLMPRPRSPRCLERRVEW
jgi:pimeloyl-ACP methyl ester carboxylesterase